MKKRLLIIVSGLLQGGIETLLVQYLKHLDRSKFSITLGIGLCMEEQEVYIGSIPKDVRVVYLLKSHRLVRYRKRKQTGRLPLPLKVYDEVFLNPLRRAVQKRSLNKLLGEHDVLIDFNSTFYSFLKKCPIPSVAFFHFSFRQYRRGNRRKQVSLGKKLAVYDRIVTICDAMRAEGVEMYPHLKDKFLTIYNGLDFPAIKSKSLDGAEAPLAAGPYILAVQRLEETQKDATTLIKAYKLLCDEYGIRERLCVIGEGGSRPMLEALCRELGVEDRVDLPGFTQNPYPWIGHCRCFVLSSKFEGLPTVLLEAMSLNRFIVSSDCPTGPAEILDGGNAGALVPVGDEAAMTAAIYRMLTDEAYRQRMAEGMKRQIAKFDVTNVLRRIEGLVTEMTSESAG